MKALQITAPGKTAFVEIPAQTPGPDDVLLHVQLIGYCGSDLNTFRGLNPLVQYPRIPGHEIGARIVARGANVPAEWTIGLPVTLSPYTHCGQCSACRQGRFNCCQHNQTLGVQRDGALTEYVIAPWRKLFHSPQLGLRELALVEPLTIGFHAVDRGRVTAQDTVLVFGCGAIGLGAIAAAACRGARVIAVDIDDAKLAVATKCGATATINSRTTPVTAAPDVVIEAVGSPQTFRAAVDVVNFAGRVVYIGYAKQPVEYETKYFVMKELDILGSRNATPQDFQAVIQMLATGRFPVAAVITQTVPFAEAGAALAAWSENPGAQVKIQVRLA